MSNRERIAQLSLTLLVPLYFSLLSIANAQSGDVGGGRTRAPILPHEAITKVVAHFETEPRAGTSENSLYLAFLAAKEALETPEHVKVQIADDQSYVSLTAVGSAFCALDKIPYVPYPEAISTESGGIIFDLRRQPRPPIFCTADLVRMSWGKTIEYRSTEKLLFYFNAEGTAVERLEISGSQDIGYLFDAVLDITPALRYADQRHGRLTIFSDPHAESDHYLTRAYNLLFELPHFAAIYEEETKQRRR